MATLQDDTITSVRDIADAIDTFLTGSAGFTQDSAPTGTASGNAAWNAASAGSNTGELWLAMEWAAETTFDLHHAQGYSAPLSPGSEPGDSNHPKEVSFFGTTLSNAELFGFANNATNENERYAHFVIEFNRDGRFIHFGFGHIKPADKLGGWDGGAYVYGGEWGTGSVSYNPADQAHRLLLDSNHVQVGTTLDIATMSCRNHWNGTALSEYVGFTNTTSGSLGNDANGDPIDRAEGYARYGPWPAGLINYPGNPNNAMIPLIPVELAHRGSLSATQRVLMARMPDIAICNIRDIQPKQQITIGSDTWMFFPWAQKLVSTTSGVMASRNAGVAYKVI
jgi:hypothetical protein